MPRAAARDPIYYRRRYAPDVIERELSRSLGHNGRTRCRRAPHDWSHVGEVARAVQRPDDLHELLLVEDAAALATLNSSA